MASVIADLAGSIRDFSDQVDIYLHQIGEHEILNPFKQSTPIKSAWIDGSARRGFWKRLGIRQIISNTSQGKLEIQDHWYVERSKDDKNPYTWNSLKNGATMEGLKVLISDSPVIQFGDWANTYDASRFWDGLFSDVIKQLDKRDFGFIFQLGDITEKHVFEVDEILDIMGDYSAYGNVTLILDQHEAGKLWNRLNGLSPGAAVPDREKYLFLFNTMNIDLMLIFYGNGAVLFSKDRQFEIAGRPLNNYDRSFFNAGYQLGLLLHLEAPHCIALGLALSGARIEHAPGTGSEALLAYINDWIAELRPGCFRKNEFLNPSI